MKQKSPEVNRGLYWEITGIYTLRGAAGILSELFLLLILIYNTTSVGFFVFGMMGKFEDGF